MSSQIKMTRRQFIVNGAVAGVGGFVLAQKLNMERLGSRCLKDRVRVAIIGLGQHGTGQLAQSIALPAVEISALCDSDERVLRKSASSVQTTNRTAPELVTDYRYILDRPDIDVVLVATPVISRSQIVRSACEANKHVYVEPPWSASAQESLDLFTQVRRAGTLVRQGPFNHAWDTSAIAQLIREPDIVFEAIHMTVYQGGNEKDDHQGLRSLIDQFQLAGQLLGAIYPARVTASRGLAVSDNSYNAVTSHLSVINEANDMRGIVLQVFNIATWPKGQIVIELNTSAQGVKKEYQIKAIEELSDESELGEDTSSWTQFLNQIRSDCSKALADQLRQAHCANACYFLTEASLRSGQAATSSLA